ncbi:MAG TPA: hypothetical protein DEA08_36915 [Planctomycetes bacterium]|nr:hypothetical protein [Planctomycetota bacterium]
MTTFPTRTERDERGSAMIITLVMILTLSGLMLITTQSAVIRSNAALERGDGLDCLNAAELGVALHVQLSQQNSSLPDSSETTTYTTEDGITVVVTVDNLGNNGVDDDGDTLVDSADSKESGIYRVRSIATNVRGVSRGVEVFRRQLFHDLFYKAIYVGNAHGGSYTLNLGPGSGTPNGGGSEGTFTGNSAETDYPGSSWQSWVQNGDFVDGDIHVNGDSILISGQTDLYGDLSSTGGIMGNPISGSKDTGASPIDPPDLAAEDYRSLAVDPSVGGGVWGQGDSGLPSWLSDTPARGSNDYDYNNYHPGNYSLDNFHFGHSTSTIPLSSSDDGKVYVIKGNLWIDTRGITDFHFPATTDGVKITVVVEGNLYLADGVAYEDATKDGVLFIVKSTDDPSLSGESYDDVNQNGVYDAGTDTIIDNDGDGVYEGPTEGQGNIWFGDKVAPKGGVTEGYYYAQNNVYIAPTSQTQQEYGVYGFLSAGGKFYADDRASGNKYPSLRVKYDSRIESGSIEFPGMPSPSGGGADSLTVVVWRQIGVE